MACGPQASHSFVVGYSVGGARSNHTTASWRMKKGTTRAHQSQKKGIRQAKGHDHNLLPRARDATGGGAKQ